MAVLHIGQGQPKVPVQAEKLQADKVRLERPKPKQDDAHANEIKKRQKSESDFTKALQQLKETAHAFDRRFHFKLHEKTQQYMVQIIDIETNKVLNEVPPEKILNLVAQIRELVGLLVNKKA